MDLDAVTALLAATGPADFRGGDAWLAGGTWLFSEPQQRTRRLLDLTALGWPPLVEDGEGLHVTATCTITELAGWGATSSAPAAPLVGRCADAFLAGWKVQAQATVGGNLVTAPPAAPMVSLAAVLAAGELLRELTLPARSLGRARRSAGSP